MESTPHQAKVFSFTEHLDGQTMETYSCGNGRFISGVPGPGQEVSFSLTKTQTALHIQIHDDLLIQWLHTIPSLHGCLPSGGNHSWISMSVLLPCYPKIRAKFAQDKREGRSFEALELFFCHFLREGSVFAAFGLQSLREQQILTELHLEDIQGQSRLMSEDLDLLDEAVLQLDDSIDSDNSDESDDSDESEEFHESEEYDDSLETDEPQEAEESDDPEDSDDPEPSHNPEWRGDIVIDTFQSGLRAAIKQKDSITVRKMLERVIPGVVDVKILSRSIHFYDETVFRLLLEYGAHGLGGDDTTKLLYRASKAGHIDAVKLLLNDSVNKRGKGARYTNDCATALAGAASGVHLNIVPYLVEEHGANINGDGNRSPLLRASKHRRRVIVDYLLKAKNKVIRRRNPELFSIIDDILQRPRRESRLDTLLEEALNSSLSAEASKGRLDTVTNLVNCGIDVGSTQKGSPMYGATVNGHLEVVRFLLNRAANVKIRDVVSLIWRAAENGHLDVVDFLLGHDPEIYPTLLVTMMHLAAISGNLDAIIRLTKLGGLINPMHDQSPLWASGQYGHREAPGDQAKAGEDVDSGTHHGVTIDDGILDANDPEMRNESPWNIIGVLESHRPKATAMELCPTTAAIRAQQRRTTARRLLAKVKSSRERLLNVGARQDVSANLKTFVGQVGTSSSIWKCGTRAIRDISEGYKPSSLMDIVSALQVANAMRVAVPRSQIVCSKQEFVNDIPRWASLLSLDDQGLFFEIASHLWGIPTISVNQECTNTFDREKSLLFLQLLVKNLVNTSGLFDHDSDSSSGGSYRLQTLRQRHSSPTSLGNADEPRRSLAEWDPLPKPQPPEVEHIDVPRPPDPEEKHFSTLARITILMAGAIFGAILLWLCFCRCGLSTLRLPPLLSGAKRGSLSDQIVARNGAILAIYIGGLSLVDSEYGMTPGYVPPESNPLSTVPPGLSSMDVAQEISATAQSPHKGDDTVIESFSAGDVTMEDALADSSPSPSSHLTIFQPATGTLTPSALPTATPGSITTGTSEDGTILCEYCKSEFKLGKNGRRGQASNLRKHRRNHHPETMADYCRVLHECRWGCGARDPNKSNIGVHERRYCSVRKGKQPRRNGKWREGAVGI